MHLSNFRPVKRVTDVVEIFALVREKIPAKLVMMGDGPDRGAAEYIVRKKRLSKDVFFLGKQDECTKSSAWPTCFCCRAIPNPSAWRRSKRWPAKFRWSRQRGRRAGGGHAWRGRLSCSSPATCTRPRNTRSKFSRAPDRGREMGQHGARQRPPQILLERHYSAVRGLLREDPELGRVFRPHLEQSRGSRRLLSPIVLILAEITANIRPEFLHHVGDRVPHDVRAPYAHRVRKRALLRRMIGIGDSRSQRGFRRSRNS